jgi:putative oxidoreductase
MKSLLLLRFFRPFAPLAWPVLRIALGTLMALQGWSKVSAGAMSVAKTYEALGVPVPEIAAWAVIVAELGGGALLALGLFTRPAALAVLLTKLAAILYVHTALLGELGSAQGAAAAFAVLTAVAALGFLLRGAGSLSLDGPDDSGR